MRVSHRRDKRICRSPEGLLCGVERWHRTSHCAGGNVSVFVSGESAYPEMLRAVDEAASCIFMSVYQFDDDDVGSRFAESFRAALARDVDVRIILDAWGDVKSHPSIRRRLLEIGVEVLPFHPFRKWRRYNQRYHRKLLLVDGVVGFTGGMNIREKHLVRSYAGRAMRDTVFRVEGPVVEFLVALFAADWRYCGGETFSLGEWTGEEAGCESISVLGAGTPFRREGLREAFIGAIDRSEDRVVVLSPFFFPCADLRCALVRAVSRGVSVDVVLPSGDFGFLGWCACEYLAELVSEGCGGFFSPAPYDHSKILLVDDLVFVGTVNFDYRSFDINWEVALECQGGSLVGDVELVVYEQVRNGRRLGLDDLTDWMPRNIARKVIARTLGKWF